MAYKEQYNADKPPLFHHLPDFSFLHLDIFATLKSKAQFEVVVSTRGVRRTHPHFWTRFHKTTEYLHDTQAVEATIFGLGRYKNL